MASVIADLGGPPNIMGAQAVLLSRVREKLSVVLRIAAFIDSRERDIISPDGELVSVLSRNYLSFAESVRRDLETVTAMASRKVPRGPTLEQYLEQKRREKSAEDKRHEEKKRSGDGNGQERKEKS